MYLIRKLSILLTLTALLSTSCAPQQSTKQENADDRKLERAETRDDLLTFLQSAHAQKDLDLLTRAPRTYNRVSLLHLGKTSRPKRYELLSEAKNYIFTTVPYWFKDEEGIKMFNEYKALKSRNPNLDMRVIQDWSSPGSTGDLWGTKLLKELKKYLDGDIILWNPFWWQRFFSFDILRNRLHEKIFAVDGKYLIMGGMNIATDYLQGGETRDGWHDTDILIEGPGAQVGTKIFLKLWLLSKYLESSKYFPPFKKSSSDTLQKFFYEDQSTFTFITPKNPGDASGTPPIVTRTVDLGLNKYLTDNKYFPKLETSDDHKTPVRIIYDNPVVDNDPDTGRHFSKTMDTIQYLIANTRHSIKIFIPYLTPFDRFLDNLETAAKRGVKITIITNSIDSNDLGKIPYQAAVTHYGELIENGIAIYEWQGHIPLEKIEKDNGCEIKNYWPGKTIHSKVVLFDDSVLMVGSNNMNQRSELLNSETMALVEDRELANEMAAVFDYDLDKTDAFGNLSEPTVLCGNQNFARPNRVHRITRDIFEQIMKKNPASELIKMLQWYM